MPPLEMAPNSYCAFRGSSEADELYERAHQGEFLVYRIQPGEELAGEYLMFSSRDEDSTQVAAALAYEREIPVSATLEFDALDPKRLEEQVFPERQTFTRRILGRLGLKHGA
jgi:hypothetical protein